MVRGRLPRESNPVPGQSQPGFVPAFDETGNEDYVRVSNQKPYPVANYTQNASGVWLPTSQNNPMPTQLTGSIDEVVLFDAVSLEAGTNVESQEFDPKGARYCLVSIGIDQQPWFVRTNSRPWSNSRFPGTVYPIEFSEINGVNRSFTMSSPAVIIPVILIDEGAEVKTNEDAIEFSQKFPFRVSVWNQSENVATLTAKVLRIY